MAQDDRLLAQIRQALDQLGARIWERGADYPEADGAPPFFVTPPDREQLHAVLVDPAAEPGVAAEAAERLAEDTDLAPDLGRSLLELGRRAASARNARPQLTEPDTGQAPLGGIAFFRDFPEERVADINRQLDTNVRWQPFAGGYAALMLSGEDLHTFEDLYASYGQADPEPPEAAADSEPEEPAAPAPDAEPDTADGDEVPDEAAEAMAAPEPEAAEAAASEAAATEPDAEETGDEAAFEPYGEAIGSEQGDAGPEADETPEPEAEPAADLEDEQADNAPEAATPEAGSPDLPEPESAEPEEAAGDSEAPEPEPGEAAASPEAVTEAEEAEPPGAADGPQEAAEEAEPEAEAPTPEATDEAAAAPEDEGGGSGEGDDAEFDLAEGPAPLTEGTTASGEAAEAGEAAATTPEADTETAEPEPEGQEAAAPEAGADEGPEPLGADDNATPFEEAGGEGEAVSEVFPAEEAAEPEDAGAGPAPLGEDDAATPFEEAGGDDEPVSEVFPTEQEAEAAAGEATAGGEEAEPGFEPSPHELAEAETNIEQGMGLADPSQAEPSEPEPEPVATPAATPDPEPEPEPAPEPAPAPPAEPDPDLAEQVPASRIPWAALPGLLLDFGYLLALVFQGLEAMAGEETEGLGVVFPLLVLVGWTGILGAFLLALRRYRRGTLRVPAWWGAVALLFPWATYLAVLTRPEFEEGEARAARSFPIGGTVVVVAAVVVFAAGAHLIFLEPLLARLQAFGLEGLAAAGHQAAALGEQAAAARLEVVQGTMQGGGELAGLASGAQHAAGLSLVAALGVSVLETVGRVAWAFALPVLLPAGLLFLLPGLWRDSQVADKLAGFGSRVAVFALAFHLFVPVAGATAEALGPFLPAAVEMAAQASPEALAAENGERGQTLRLTGIALAIQDVLVPLLILWGLAWGLRRLGRPLRPIHPPRMDDEAEAD